MRTSALGLFTHVLYNEKRQKSQIYLNFFITSCMLNMRMGSQTFIDQPDKKLNEKCAVFGVYSKNHQAARLVCSGLWALQHRGQEATGISSSDGSVIRTNKGAGLVASVHTEESLEKLPGHLAIGHNRYSTFGGIFGHFQPVTAEKNLLTVAHNGNLPIVKSLRDFLQSTGKQLDHLNDSELMHKALEYYLIQGASIEEAVTKCFPLFTGAFALVILTKDKLIGVRDTSGIRPFCIGMRRDEGYILSSEKIGRAHV